MKRKQRESDLELDPFACYKMEFLHDESRLNFESTEKWLYLGANINDPHFAKVGLTMGDLRSRSSSTASPGYFLFCAFKCKHDITREKLKEIEEKALSHLERIFTYQDGQTKRALHYESGKQSECFYDVDFDLFFSELHSYLYANHYSYFVISGFEDEFGNDEGSFIDTEFNEKYLSRAQINRYIQMILQ